MSVLAVQRVLDARLGEAAVGFVGADVPIDVLLASGRPFGHLPWKTTGATPRADRWLESSFPFWVRSILEQWHDGVFDSLETVVFSRADDASQRLFYYVRELQRRGMLRGPATHMFDIAFVPRESSVAHTAAAIADLARVLGIEPRRLAEGIERANSLRATLARFAQQRASHGAVYERLARAALWSDPTTWIDEIGVPSAGPCGARVLLAGSVPPDERLHAAVESAGASVIAEAHVHGLGRLGPAVAAQAGTPERALAWQLMQASVGPRAFVDRARWIVGRVGATRADAVVIWLTREDEALAWHVPAQRRALAEAGVPTLVLPAARWSADDGAPERIADFCRGIVDAAT
jgi:2-hydroxyglutaryl-CoA dehydratase, D-component